MAATAAWFIASLKEFNVVSLRTSSFVKLSFACLSGVFFALILQKMAKISGYFLDLCKLLVKQCREIPFVLKQLAIMVVIKVIFLPSDVAFEVFMNHEVVMMHLLI